MKFIVRSLLLLLTIIPAAAENAAQFDSQAAERFANLALACVHKEYPNHISHALNSDADVAPPRKLTPAFYGCYDWHSSVHGHWLLVRLVRSFPDAKFVPSARAALRESLTAEYIAQEAAYLRGEARASFERPYGLAWLLQLAAELREWDDPDTKEMSANIRPRRGCSGTPQQLAPKAFKPGADRRARSDCVCARADARLRAYCRQRQIRHTCLLASAALLHQRQKLSPCV
jgi:hypothetical protein